MVRSARPHTGRARRALYRRRRFAAAFCLAAACAAGLGAAAARAGGPRPVQARVVVRPGQTLWTLGEHYAPPGADLRRWVFRVEALNGLSGGTLQAGQVLRLPR